MHDRVQQTMRLVVCDHWSFFLNYASFIIKIIEGIAFPNKNNCIFLTEKKVIERPIATGVWFAPSIDIRQEFLLFYLLVENGHKL